MSVKWLRDVPLTAEGRQASYADLERQMPTRLEGWRASVQTALTEQWVDAQAAIAELPPAPP